MWHGIGLNSMVSYCLSLKIHIMGNLLYAITIILVIVWAVGFLAFHAGGLIHILLIMALIAYFVRMSGGRNIV